MVKPKFGYKYLGAYNPLENQLLYDKQTGDIYTYYDKPKNVLDKIASRHDTCFSVGKNKNDCDRIMVKEIDNIPYKERPYGTFAIKQIINTKHKLGLGNNFTMEDLSIELNKPVINKFERKKVIVNHIDEIHGCDLVDMQKYSKVNRGYKCIFTNIDIFSKYAWSFPLKTKQLKKLNLVFKKFSKNVNQNIFGVIKNHHFSVNKCQNFSKTTMQKFIIHIHILKLSLLNVLTDL